MISLADMLILQKVFLAKHSFAGGWHHDFSFSCRLMNGGMNCFILNPEFVVNC